MFVFRNNTIENLFPEVTKFSGYGDISLVPTDESEFVWFYQVPIHLDEAAQLRETESFIDKFRLVSSQVGNRPLYVLSLENIYPVKIVDTSVSLQNAVIQFNETIRDLAKSNVNIRFIDFSEYLNQFSPSEWINWRFYFISQMILSPTIATGFYPWFNKQIGRVRGNRKKALILDLDNTLWGGVIGEDGVEGIKIGGDYPGNAYLYFQEGIAELARKGIILTVCSKNNESDVLEAWEKNPFLKLREKDFVARRINWNNKADNIRELAAELNIGLDSMVFVDDNPTERELVRRELPMVSVPEFPKKPFGLMFFYQQLVEDYFRTYSLTTEDLHKTDQYAANARRTQQQSKFSNLEDFIRSLDIKIDIEEANVLNLSRIAQMTQKTNQFNLTTHRYTEADIIDLLKDGARVFCISVVDKFGDNGITGAIIMRPMDTVVNIDTMLMSCRILGKRIEEGFLNAIINKLFSEGIKRIGSTYIPTAKNSQVADFYDRMGFTLDAESPDGIKKYHLDLTGPITIHNLYSISFK